MVGQSQTFTQMISKNMRLNTPEKLENLMKILLGKRRKRKRNYLPPIPHHLL